MILAVALVTVLLATFWIEPSESAAEKNGREMGKIMRYLAAQRHPFHRLGGAVRSASGSPWLLFSVTVMGSLVMMTMKKNQL